MSRNGVNMSADTYGYELFSLLWCGDLIL
jgi:hypothetical protein